MLDPRHTQHALASLTSRRPRRRDGRWAAAVAVCSLCCSRRAPPRVGPSADAGVAATVHLRADRASDASPTPDAAIEPPETETFSQMSAAADGTVYGVFCRAPRRARDQAAVPPLERSVFAALGAPDAPATTPEALSRFASPSPGSSGSFTAEGATCQGDYVLRRLVGDRWERLLPEPTTLSSAQVVLRHRSDEPLAVLERNETDDAPREPAGHVWTGARWRSLTRAERDALPSMQDDARALLSRGGRWLRVGQRCDRARSRSNRRCAPMSLERARAPVAQGDASDSWPAAAAIGPEGAVLAAMIECPDDGEAASCPLVSYFAAGLAWSRASLPLRVAFDAEGMGESWSTPVQVDWSTDAPVLGYVGVVRGDGPSSRTAAVFRWTGNAWRRLGTEALDDRASQPSAQDRGERGSTARYVLAVQSSPVRVASCSDDGRLQFFAWEHARWQPRPIRETSCDPSTAVLIVGDTLVVRDSLGPGPSSGGRVLRAGQSTPWTLAP